MIALGSDLEGTTSREGRYMYLAKTVMEDAEQGRGRGGP